MANIRDLAVGQVATAPSPASSGTSLVLQAGQGADMPTTTPFKMLAFSGVGVPTKYNSELVNVTARSTDTLTIQRAQGDTSAQAIAVGWYLVNPLLVEHLDAKENKADTETRESEGHSDYVASGVVISGDAYASTRNYSITSGVVYLSGKRLTVASVSAQTVTASKDRYIDLHDNGDGTAVYVTTEVNNNAASPSLAAGDLRVGIVIAGASNIASVASVNQGQIGKLLPVASNISYAVSDSLGNLICPRTPYPTLLAHRIQQGGAQSGITTAVDLRGQSAVVNVPAGRSVRVYAANTTVSTVASDRSGLNLLEDGVSMRQTFLKHPGTDSSSLDAQAYSTPSAGTHTYKVQCSRISGTGSITGESGAYMSVELV